MRSGPRTEEDRENPHTGQNVLCSLQKSLKLLSGLFVLFCVIPPPSPPPQDEDKLGPGDGLLHFLL